jgi:hypothetical protein
MVGVIEILQATSNISANRLHGGAGYGVNPNVVPGWWYFEFTDALEIRAAHSFEIGSLVSEPAFLCANAVYSRPLKLFQPCH